MAPQIFKVIIADTTEAILSIVGMETATSSKLITCVVLVAEVHQAARDPTSPLTTSGTSSPSA
jgi:hypothetical protein